MPGKPKRARAPREQAPGGEQGSPGTAPPPTDEVPFGCCELCGEPVLFPFWDRYCEDCQRRDEHTDDEWDDLEDGDS